MKDELSQEQTKAVLDALDDAIGKGPWEASNFLRVIGNNLRQIREDFSQQLNDSGVDAAKQNLNASKSPKLSSGQQEVYIAMYSSDGSNILSWATIISNLPKQMISRPIYQSEQDVKDVIRTKEHQINEGYVSINVSQDDLLVMSADKMPVDKLGKPLLSLKNKALKTENINRFVHQSGLYQYSNGRLNKISANESD